MTRRPWTPRPAPNPFDRFHTQADVDREIDRLTRLELAAEVRRDAEEFESRMYWHYHDVAVRYRVRAVDLMPKGS